LGHAASSKYHDVRLTNIFLIVDHRYIPSLHQHSELIQEKDRHRLLNHQYSLQKHGLSW